MGRGKVSSVDRVGKIFTHPKYGEYQLIRYNSPTDIYIKFSRTGNVLNTNYSNAVKAGVKDSMQPSVYGVGVIGGFRYTGGVRALKSYSAWVNMIARCYDEGRQIKQPTYRDCSVCGEWKYFPNFKKWFDENYIEGYQLDKDIKIQGNRLYSPNTCMFVSQADNAIQAAYCRMYPVILLSPKGTEVVVNNQSKFCRDNALHSGALNGVINGKCTHHKGWKFVRRLDP